MIKNDVINVVRSPNCWSEVGPLFVGALRLSALLVSNSYLSTAKPVSSAVEPISLYISRQVTLPLNDHECYFSEDLF